MILATGRGLAVVRRASRQPANDNVPGTITPDDRPFFLALALICAIVLTLAAYAALSAPAEVMGPLQG